MASGEPRRVSALVLVDGFAMPATPPALSALGRHRVAQRLLGVIVQKLVYTRRALPRAFADLRRAPDNLDDTIEHQWPRIVPRYVQLLVAGDGSPAPRMPILLLWGTRDRLPGTDRRAAERLRDSLRDATLTWIDDAGHFPQVEQPARFVSALEAHLSTHTPA
jgi:pimeloyl-ACP methyl ester carboxylesterase